MGRTILVTGATDGIGRRTAVRLAELGHHVIVHGRNDQRIERVLDEIHEGNPAVSPSTVTGDFASLRDVEQMARDLCANHPVIDVLLNNVGIYQKHREVSEDGYEMTLAVNHLAPFLLTHLLLPLVRLSDAGRIINVSSVAHIRGNLSLENLQLEQDFDEYKAYAASKLANVLFTVELAKRLGPRPVAHALHPGVVSTKLLRDGFGTQGTDSLDQGTETSVFLAHQEGPLNLTGRYYVRCRPSAMHPLASNAKFCRDFYAACAQLVGIDPLPR